MNLEDAKRVNRYFKEISNFDDKLNVLKEFIENYKDNYLGGELQVKTSNGLYRISLIEEFEMNEVVRLLEDYYENKKESLVKLIEEI